MSNIMKVWTNGKAIRKYTGQDKIRYCVNHSEKDGWGKKIAVLMTEDEYDEHLKNK